MSPLRPGRDDDAAAIIALIGACWAEYPGIVMDVDGEMPELRAFASHVAARGGALFVADGADGLDGMAGIMPDADGAWHLTRMYVAAAARGTGLADTLLDAAEAHARGAGATRLALHSDTRFARAHRFYERRFYVREGPIVAVHDLSNTLEYGYAKPVSDVASLDAAASVSAVRTLADLLVACVQDGAQVWFMADLSHADAEAFWRGVAAKVAHGDALLFAAWHDARLVGCIVLDIGMPPNQPHRASPGKLLVHPGARGRRIGRALADAAEAAASGHGRTLLTCDARADGPAEAFWRAAGYTVAGRIPGYARDPDGTLTDVVALYKQIEAA